MLVRELHAAKAPYPIEVTLLGMVTLVRLEQDENASLPIEVTLSGMIMLVRLEQLRMHNLQSR